MLNIMFMALALAHAAAVSTKSLNTLDDMSALIFGSTWFCAQTLGHTMSNNTRHYQAAVSMQKPGCNESG
jgi:hypothetical protein